jgi:transposase-like protein/DNA-binding XRE family transcriptional regulator
VGAPRVPQKIKDECVHLRITERASVCRLSRKFGLSTATIYPWIKHIPLARREHKAPSTAWRIEEKVKLRQLWPFAPWHEILQLIPRHTRYAISHQASKMKLKRHPEANSRRDKNVDPLFLALRTARELKGLTRKQIAKKLGYHHIQIARWELGDDTPAWRALKLWVESVDRVLIVSDIVAGGERVIVSAFPKLRASPAGELERGVG